MAQSAKARVAKAQAKLDGIVSRVFALAPSRDVRLRDCLDMAPEELREEYEAAFEALIEAERAAVSQGRAYRAMGGALLLWNK